LQAASLSAVPAQFGLLSISIARQFRVGGLRLMAPFLPAKIHIRIATILLFIPILLLLLFLPLKALQTRPSLKQVTITFTMH
jgi:hypothetical protein